jgi:hypothetical protein
MPMTWKSLKESHSKILGFGKLSLPVSAEKLKENPKVIN